MDETKPVKCEKHSDCPWDEGREIVDLDIPTWVKKFHYEFVSEDTLGPNAAIHALTTQGKELQLGQWDVLIVHDFKQYLDFLMVHEAVENWLRRKGWLYQPSHEYSEHVEDELFGDDPKFVEYRSL